jgi:hypothetical protein
MRTLGAFGPLVGLAAILTVFVSLYVLLGENPPETLEPFLSVAPGFFLVYWMVIDARRRHRIPCHDFGFLAGVFLPLALPWYLVWTRGLKGLLLLGVFLLLFWLPWICATIVWMVRYGQRP